MLVTVNADELEDAVLTVSDPDTSDEGWVSLDTGAVYLRSDALDEELAPLPEDIETSERYVPVPRVGNLALGLELVFDFADAALPDDAGRVRAMFKHAGGYREFSELVEQKGLSGHWHVFREAQTRAVLGAWCEQHGLQLEEAELPN